MFDFGDELVIDSYRIPWLIWIQLIVMLLIIILLYYFTTTAFDLSHHHSAAAASSSTGTHLISCESRLNISPLTTTSCLLNSKVGEHRNINETGTSTSRGIARKEDIQEREGYSTMDGTHVTYFGHSHHPCHLFGLAKQAFLKCLGLDSTSESSSSRKHRKER